MDCLCGICITACRMDVKGIHNREHTASNDYHGEIVTSYQFMQHSFTIVSEWIFCCKAQLKSKTITVLDQRTTGRHLGVNSTHWKKENNKNNTMRAPEARSMPWYFWTRQPAASDRFDLIQPTTLNHWLIATFHETKYFVKLFRLLFWHCVYIYAT